MGLKSKLNKMKNFLFDEEEEKKSILSKKKKNNTDKIIEKKVVKEEKYDNSYDNTENLFFEDEKEVSLNNEISLRTEKKENVFDFPEFNENDFAPLKPQDEFKPKEKENKVLLYQGSKRREEIKKFKPSPIISPIYGLLDQEGNTISDNKKLKEELLNEKKEATIDDVRKKAYGLKKESISSEELRKKTIEEAEKDMEEEEKVFSRENKKIEKVEKKVVLEEDDEDDEMILPNIDFKEIKLNEPTNKNDIDDEDDTKEQDLFNLIDTMYSKEEKED